MSVVFGRQPAQVERHESLELVQLECGVTYHSTLLNSSTLNCEEDVTAAIYLSSPRRQLPGLS
jgi:hypothetical protein